MIQYEEYLNVRLIYFLGHLLRSEVKICFSEMLSFVAVAPKPSDSSPSVLLLSPSGCSIVEGLILRSPLFAEMKYVILYFMLLLQPPAQPSLTPSKKDESFLWHRVALLVTLILREPVETDGL